MVDILREQILIVLGVLGALILILLIVILELRRTIKHTKLKIQELEKRLKGLRGTHEFMVKELTARIDELNVQFSKRKRTIQSVLNLAIALSELREKKEIIDILTEQTKNITNSTDVFFFNAIDGGLRFVLYEHKSFDEKQLYRRGELIYRLGEGAIGYVAKKRFTMDKETMFQDALVDGIPESELIDPFGIDYEVIAPLVFQNKIFGVIAISGVKPEKIKGLSYIEPKEEAIRAAMEAVQMITEIGAMVLHSTELVEKIQKMADTDDLTGIYNKRYFKDKLNELIIRAKMNKTKVGLFMMDIDFFKKYNDENGHPNGDLLLKSIARILKKTSESLNGIPARYGGEEFVIILPEKDKKQTLRYGEMVRQIIERTRFPNEEKQPGGKLTISGGVAVFPDDAEDAETLIEKADKALYKAKESGKNRVLAFG